MVKLFFSYSHRDEPLRDELEIHLAGLKRQGVIGTWHDRRVGAGEEFDREISGHLESAQIILLLVSPYFIASDYCYDVEMARALERHRAGDARVMPVILHPCDWHSLPFGKLAAVPKDGKPVSKYPNQHDAFLEVALAIREAAKDLAAPADRHPAPQVPGAVSPPAARPASDARSSDLRVRKTFTRREKDRFERAAYEYIEKYFENSLAELAARNAKVETECRRVGADQFTATAYVGGREAGSCVIRHDRGGNFIKGVSFSYGRRAPATGLNESLCVEDDGHGLYLKPLGVAAYRPAADERLSMEGAAEFYWGLFMEQLPR